MAPRRAAKAGGDVRYVGQVGQAVRTARLPKGQMAPHRAANAGGDVRYVCQVGQVCQTHSRVQLGLPGRDKVVSPKLRFRLGKYI